MATQRPRTPRPPRESCAFCGRTQSQVDELIKGPDVNICTDCVMMCNQIMGLDPQPGDAQGDAKPADADNGRAAAIAALKVPLPHEINALLDDYVVGQASAKKILSVAVYNHYKRLRQESHFEGDAEFRDVEIEKSNVMMIGPTGCGKTLLARTLAHCLDVPFSISDATTLTEAGYVGEDVENILLRLIQAADGDIARAEMGIIYIDEIDKIGRKTENVSLTRDVSGEGVQQALLKILEGTVANVPPQGGRKHPQQEYLRIRTDNILFICGGAFVGLEDIVRRRLGRQVLGFSDSAGGDDGRTTSPAVEPEDLLHYGFLPELIGRLPITSNLKALDEDDLVRVLTEPKNAMVRQYQKLMAMEGVRLTFEPDALRELAHLAVRKKTGARGLRTLIETVMLEIMFEIPKQTGLKTFEVTRQMVIDQKSSLVRKRAGNKDSKAA